MKRFLRQLKASTVVNAILCMLLGAALLIWPDISAKVFCRAVGITFLLAGVVNVIIFLISHDGTVFSRMNLAVGVIFASIGLFIAFKPETIMTIVPIIIGIFILIHGLFDAKQTIDLIRFQYSKWYFALLFSILTIAFGVVIILNPFETLNSLMILVGAALLYDGISDIWIVAKLSGITKRMKKELKQQFQEIPLTMPDQEADESIQTEEVH